MYRLLTIALAGFVASACGGDDAGTLERAERQLADLERGVITFTVAAGSTGANATTGQVGYTLDGSFDTSTDTAFPLLDLRYTRMLGDEEQAFEIKSDGTKMAIVEDGVTTEIPADQAETLRIAGEDGAEGPVDGLALERWIDDPVEVDGPTIEGVATRTISGDADAVAVLRDLSVMLAQVAGQPAPPTLDDAAADRIRSVVREGTAEMTIDDDDIPRSVRVSILFAGDPPPQLAEVFGTLAGVRLDMELTISQPNQPITPPTLP